MSATSLALRLPVQDRASANPAPSLAALAAGVARRFRARWVYQTTLASLENYSERNLQDIGADRGIEEFARRAAGF